MTNQPKPEVCPQCGNDRSNPREDSIERMLVCGDSFHATSAKPEVKGIEKFRQVERFQAYDIIDGDGVELTGVVRESDYADLFAFAKEQGKREVEIVSHHNTLVRLQAEQRQRAETAEARLKAMEEVVEAAKKLADLSVRKISYYYTCQICLEGAALGSGPTKHRPLPDGSPCPVGIVLGRVG